MAPVKAADLVQARIGGLVACGVRFA